MGVGGHIILRPLNLIFCFHVNPLPPSVCHTLNSQGADLRAGLHLLQAVAAFPVGGAEVQCGKGPPQQTWILFQARW